MRVLACYNKRKGFCYIKDEIPEEILRNSFSNRELKENYLRHVGLCVLDIKNFALEFPVEMEFEEEE